MNNYGLIGKSCKEETIKIINKILKQGLLIPLKRYFKDTMSLTKNNALNKYLKGNINRLHTRQKNIKEKPS